MKTRGISQYENLEKKKRTFEGGGGKKPFISFAIHQPLLTCDL